MLGLAPERHAARIAYAAIVARARAPGFYAARGVPDTLDGRFELIALHAFLVLHRLRAEPAAQGFAQALFDAMFQDMDRGLREMGTGDLSVGKQVKRMATGFYGRIDAYQAGLAAGDPTEALRRNLFGTLAEPDAAQVAWFAAYLADQAAALAGQPAIAIATGRVEFAPFPAEAAP
ncbi:MAG TPA: ubiquinol-cytochrome C chaperone family protein [Stellaceae bacterium]|nr:ubiquinol-cytochrome C chaperone family protein [Stellaceae bacterium]